jgi:hypothetical protein
LPLPWRINHLTERDVVKGATFIKDGEAYKGSSIGAKWSRYKGSKNPSNLDEDCLIISEIVQISPKDIPLMKAANLKSQQHTVKLDELNRAMFDRAAEMAEIAALNQGRNGKFRNGRVEVTLNGDRLKVRRVRPEKLTLEAVKVDGEWQTVGFPNIEKVDVQLLERINQVEQMNFKAIEQQSSSVQKPRTDRRETTHELRVDIEEPEGWSEDDELESLISAEVTPKIQLQHKIDWAVEQTIDSGEEYIEYLAQQNVETKFVRSVKGETNIIYKWEGVNFEDTELTNATLTLLESTRGLSFNYDSLMKSSKTQIKTTEAIDYDKSEDDTGFVIEEDYSI